LVKRQDVIRAERLTLVAKAAKFLQQDAAVFLTVGFAQKDGVNFPEQPLGTAEDLYLSSLDVALQKVRWMCGRPKIIQGNPLDLNRSGRAVRYHVAKSTIRRSLRIGSRKKHRAGFRPNGSLFYGNRGELIALHVATKTLGNLRVGFKRHNASFGPDEPRGKKRKKPDVGPNIVKGHSWPKMPLQGKLHFRFANTSEIIGACAGVQTEPEALGWPTLDLHPRE
jgi:hypothetical protein